MIICFPCRKYSAPHTSRHQCGVAGGTDSALRLCHVAVSRSDSQLTRVRKGTRSPEPSAPSPVPSDGFLLLPLWLLLLLLLVLVLVLNKAQPASASLWYSIGDNHTQPFHWHNESRLKQPLPNDAQAAGLEPLPASPACVCVRACVSVRLPCKAAASKAAAVPRRGG